MIRPNVGGESLAGRHRGDKRHSKNHATPKEGLREGIGGQAQRRGKLPFAAGWFFHYLHKSFKIGKTMIPKQKYVFVVLDVLKIGDAEDAV
jgi:hypothetical protein